MLSKSLRYAADVELIDHAPRVGMFKLERPEFVATREQGDARMIRRALLEVLASLEEDEYRSCAT